MGPENNGFKALGGPDHYAKAPIAMPSDLEARKIAEHFFTTRNGGYWPKQAKNAIITAPYLGFMMDSIHDLRLF